MFYQIMTGEGTGSADQLIIIIDHLVFRITVQKKGNKSA